MTRRGVSALVPGAGGGQRGALEPGEWPGASAFDRRDPDDWLSLPEAHFFVNARRVKKAARCAQSSKRRPKLRLPLAGFTAQR